MNMGTLKYNLNYNIKRTIRKLDNLNKKKNSIECSIIFNESCLQQYIYSLDSLVSGCYDSNCLNLFQLNSQILMFLVYLIY